MLRRRFPKVEIVQGRLQGKPRRTKMQEASPGPIFSSAIPGWGRHGFMRYCRKIGKPYGLYGQSYFPSIVEGRDAEERIELLTGAAFVYCREARR